MGEKIFKIEGWRQDSPILQMAVLLMSADGSLSNAMDLADEGVTSIKSLARAQGAVDQLQELRWFLNENPHAWPESGFVVVPDEF